MWGSCVSLSDYSLVQFSLKDHQPVLLIFIRIQRMIYHLHYLLLEGSTIYQRLKNKLFDLEFSSSRERTLVEWRVWSFLLCQRRDWWRKTLKPIFSFCVFSVLFYDLWSCLNLCFLEELIPSGFLGIFSIRCQWYCRTDYVWCKTNPHPPSVPYHIPPSIART